MQGQSSEQVESDSRTCHHGPQATYSFHLYFVIPLRNFASEIRSSLTFSPCSQVLGKNLVPLICNAGIK